MGKQRQGPSSVATNPFVRAPEETARPADETESTDVRESTGPVLPPGAPYAPTRRILRQDRDLGGAGAIVVTGVHGGAGASTVERLLRYVSRVGGRETVRTADAPVGVIPAVGGSLLVARVSGAGLARAHDAAREWGAGDHPGLALLGLVLVPTGPKPVRELSDATRRVSRMFPRTWQLRWVPEWHLHEDAPLDVTPRSVGRTGKKILGWSTERGLQPEPNRPKEN